MNEMNPYAPLSQYPETPPMAREHRQFLVWWAMLTAPAILAAIFFCTPICQEGMNCIRDSGPRPSTELFWLGVRSTVYGAGLSGLLSTLGCLLAYRILRAIPIWSE